MFIAVIDSDRHKFIWSKAISALAALSDNIKFIITPTSLSISAVNTARTSNGEIIFKKSFFYEYLTTFDDKEYMIEGYEEEIIKDADDNREVVVPSYSFVVNSKHLSVLFRNLDVADLEYICFKIHWSNISDNDEEEDEVDREEGATAGSSFRNGIDNSLKYKLLIEIRTKKLILKKFQTGFQPVFKNELKIAKAYNEEFTQNRPEAIFNHLHYIKIEQFIFKQFIDMIPSATEDFKIEIKNETIQFSGFTKAITKDREYIKQPMSVTISVFLEELLDTNLSENVESRPTVESIMFRLKDFKNFINFVTSFSDGNKSNDSVESSDIYLEMLYRRPGDPILFELKNNLHLTVQFIQITNAVDAETTSKGSRSATPKESMMSLKSHVFHKIDVAREYDSEESDRRRAIKNSRKNLAVQRAEKRQRSSIETHIPNEYPETEGGNHENRSGSDDADDPFALFVPEYSQPSSSSAIASKRESNRIALEDTEYEDSDHKDDDEEEEGTEEFGPTQGVKRPKSIFD